MASSDYFLKKLSGPWRDSQVDEHKLEDVSVQVFELFVQWLYSGNISMRDAHDKENLLIHAWALGDRLLSDQFKNTIINALYDDWKEYNFSWPKNMSFAALSYEVSPEGSQLRKLVIDKYSRHTREEMIRDTTQELPNDLLRDLAEASASFITDLHTQGIKARPLMSLNREDLQFDVCERYHIHKSDEEPCDAEMIAASFAV